MPVPCVRSKDVGDGARIRKASWGGVRKADRIYSVRDMWLRTFLNPR